MEVSGCWSKPQGRLELLAHFELDLTDLDVEWHLVVHMVLRNRLVDRIEGARAELARGRTRV